MNQKSIIVKEVTTYKLTEQIEIYYVSFPKRGIDKVSMKSPKIEDAFNFNTESLLLKFHPQKKFKCTHIHYGNGITKIEWIYIDKEPNDEIFHKIRDLKDMKINIHFPKVIKDSNKESITDN
jgi:hypothetical protein